MKNPQQIIVGSETSLKQAMHLLEATGQTLLLLVDHANRLTRTVTDGDLRRLLMQGGSFESRLSELPPHSPITASEPTNPSAALELMNQRQIDQLPVVDETGRPVGFFLRRDLDTQILLSTPHMGDEERDFVESAFQTNWIAPLGPNVEAFEQELAAHVKISHAAAVTSGTAAIHLALRLLKIRPGDRIFCSSFTFAATANPILYEGAIPVFIDSEPGSWNMSPGALARALAEADRNRSLPKAVIVVNLYGQSADLAPLLEMCNRYDVAVVEDAAESLGATYHGKASGTLGRLGIYSFNGNKIITTSGGGMLVSDDKTLIQQARFLSTQARDVVPSPYYQHSQLGFNYRMSNVLAGIGRGQLKVLESRVASRRAIFERYAAGLSDLPAISWMPEAAFGRSTRWLTTGVLNPKTTDLDPERFIRRLADEKIEARHVWKPLHRQPLFANCAYYPHQPEESICDDFFNRGFCLPSGSNLTPEQHNRIIRCVRQALH